MANNKKGIEMKIKNGNQLENCLGKRVKDIITGYEGIVVSISTWLNKCRRFGVQAQGLKDGEPRKVEYVDVEQAEFIGEEKIDLQTKPSGGPKPAPVKF
jgi:hypothetical protein